MIAQIAKRGEAKIIVQLPTMKIKPGYKIQMDSILREGLGSHELYNTWEHFSENRNYTFQGSTRRLQSILFIKFHFEGWEQEIIGVNSTNTQNNPCI